MFSDGELLLLLLWGIYLWECLIWHDRYGLVFRSWWGGGWHLAGMSHGSGGMGKTGWEVVGHGAVWGNPLCWGGQTVLGELFPISISPERVAAGNIQTVYTTGRPCQRHRGFAFAELREVAIREEELWLNGVFFCRFPSEFVARGVLMLLRKLRDCLPAEREEHIRTFWRGRFDRKAFRGIWEPCQAAARRLQWSCMGLFLILYVVAPVLTMVVGTSWVILFGGPLVFLSAFAIEWGAFRFRRRLGVGTLSAAVGEWIKGALCPPVAIRAADRLTRDVAPLFDPLTVAAELLPEEGGGSAGVADFFAKMSADLRHPLVCDGVWDDFDRAAMEWQCGLVLEEATRAFPGQREALSERVPERLEPVMRAYCPRCGSQYAAERETCPDCPGVRLGRWHTKDVERKKRMGKHRRCHRRPGRRK